MRAKRGNPSMRLPRFARNDETDDFDLKGLNMIYKLSES